MASEGPQSSLVGGGGSFRGGPWPKIMAVEGEVGRWGDFKVVPSLRKSCLRAHTAICEADQPHLPGVRKKLAHAILNKIIAFCCLYFIFTV